MTCFMVAMTSWVSLYFDNLSNKVAWDNDKNLFAQKLLVLLQFETANNDYSAQKDNHK